MSERVLITGGAGLIGLATARCLAEAGRDVVVYDLPEQLDRAAGMLPEGVTAVRGTVLDRAALDEAMTGCEAVVHLAARLGVRRTEADHVGAANAYRRAAELEETSVTDAARHGRTLLELGETLIDIGDADEARSVLERARDTAESGGAPVVAAMAVGYLGQLDEMEGRTDSAAALYRDAARLAAEAGGADAHEMWRRSADQLV